MTQRVLLAPNNIKVSRPGYDVVSSTNPDELILDALAGIGYISSQTGTVTISGFTGYPAPKAVIPYSSNGSIPFILVQCNRGGSALGGGFTYHTSTTSNLEDTIPPTRVYSTSPITADTEGFDFYYSTSNMYIQNFESTSRTFRYYIFTANQAANSGGSYPTTMTNGGWNNITGDTSAERKNASVTITGIGGPISLRLITSAVLTSGQQIKVYKNGAVVGTISSGQNSTDFTVTLGDSVWFGYLGSVAISNTNYIQNLSTGASVHSSFTIVVSGTVDYNIEHSWSNVTTNGNSGGSTYLIADQRLNPIGTINVTVPLYVQTSRALVAGEVIQIYYGATGPSASIVATISEGGTTSGSFSVINGYDLRIRYGSISGSHSLTISVYNTYSSTYLQGSWVATINDSYVAGPDYTFDSFDVGDVNGEAYFGANTLFVGTSATLTGANQTVSMRFQMSATVPSGMTVYIAKNNATYVAVIGPGEYYADFTVVSGDYLDARGQKTTNGTYNGTGYFVNLSTGSTVVDTVNFSILRSSGGPA